MQVILKRGNYRGSELTQDQLEFLNSKKIKIYDNDTLEIRSGILVKLENGELKEFSSNLSYLEYLYDKKSN